MGRGGFPLLGRRFVARGAFITLERCYHLGDGAAWTARDIVRHPGSVAVIPWDGRQVHLMRQYRAAVGAPLLELPAGKRDVPGEDPAETARRECVEEVGLLPGRLTLLHEAYTSPGLHRRADLGLPGRGPGAGARRPAGHRGGRRHRRSP